MNQTLINVADVICHAFSNIDSHLVNHGERVAYILMKIFEDKKEISNKEKQDIFMLGLLHDIGVYNEKEINAMLSLNSPDSMEHSILGYLLLKTFSPLQEYADIILYHHRYNAQYYSVPISDYHRRLASLLYLSDRIDIFCELNDASQLYSFLDNFSGSDFTKQDVQWFQNADQKFHIVEHLLSNTYHQDVIYYTSHHLNLTDAQIYDFLRLFIFSIDFRNEYTVLHTGYAIQFSKKIASALGLPFISCKTIELAALLHNIGKVSLPVQIETMNDYDWYLKEVYKSSTQDITKCILRDTVSPEILQIIEQSYQLLDGWSGSKKIDIPFLQESEILALSYLLSNALTLDEDIGAHHDEQLLYFLKDRYRICGMDTDLLLTLEKEYKNIVRDSKTACASLSDTYKQMMEEYRSLDIILMHYNRKYH